MRTSRKSSVEKHREAMRSHRGKNKLAGLIDLRLGWGTPAERTALQVVLAGLRDPLVAANVQKMIASISEAPKAAPNDGFSAMKDSDRSRKKLGPEIEKPHQVASAQLAHASVCGPSQKTPQPIEARLEDWCADLFML